MQCPHCGTENPNDGVYCVQCDQWIFDKVNKEVSNSLPQQQKAAGMPKSTKKLIIMVGTIAIICLATLCVALVVQILVAPDQTIADTLPIDTATPTTPAATIPNTTVYEVQLPLTIDWDMAAYLISFEGDVIKTCSIAISGDIKKEIETATYLYLTIDHPDDLRYWFSSPSNDYVPSLPFPLEKPGDFFVSYLFTYDKVENVLAACCYGINTEKEYFLAYWGESYGYYLVACTDPDVAPQDIVEHYKDYLEAVRFD